MESLKQGSSNIPSIMNKGFYMTSEEFYAKFPEFKAAEEKPIPLKKKNNNNNESFSGRSRSRSRCRSRNRSRNKNTYNRYKTFRKK